MFGGMSKADMAALALIASAFSFFLVEVVVLAFGVTTCWTGAAVDDEMVIDVDMVEEPQLLLAPTFKWLDEAEAWSAGTAWLWTRLTDKFLGEMD